MMLRAIKNYCDNTEISNGLFLLDMPTGFGKTYNVRKYIFDAIEKNNDKKIFFITSLKKNLPNEELQADFELVGKGNIYRDKVMRIQSTSEAMLDGLYKCIDDIPDDVKRHKTFVAIKSDADFIHNNTNGSYTYKTSLKTITEQLGNKTEPAFRRYITSLLKKTYPSAERRLKAIKTEKEWQWVGVMYPSVFTCEKQVYFLSMDKFLGYNSTLIAPSYRFLNNAITENAIIFIDEFDATKETVLKKIIDDNLQNKIDYIRLFEYIHSALTQKTFPTDMTNMSEKFFVDDNPRKHTSLETVDNLRENARRIFDKYKINFSYKTSSEAQDGTSNFLFHDYKHHSILKNDNNKYVSIRSDDEANRCWVDFTSVPPEKSENNVFNMLSEIRGFITYFQGAVNIIANNYRQYKNDNREDNEDEFTRESAVHTIITLFGLEGKYEWFIMNGIFSASKKNEISNSKQSLDLTFYEKGFRYYDFIDSEEHDLQSQIILSSFNNTPEKTLLALCNRAKVIGISATASLDTVIGNYNIGYLKSKLGSNFYIIPTSDYEELKNDFELNISGYEKISIHTEFISGKSECGKYEEDCWRDIFDNDELVKHMHTKLLTETSSDDTKDYIRQRYLRIAKSFNEFIKHDEINSFLCMLNKHPKDNDRELNTNVLKEIFKLIADSNGKPFDYSKQIWLINGDDFDNKKQALTRKLANGAKIFVISVYQTLGAGQNLQYPIPNGFDTIKSNNAGYNSNEKDFDAIYLDNPTNILVLLGDKLVENDFVKSVFQAEYLMSVGEMSEISAMKRIKSAFKCFTSQQRQQGNIGEQSIYGCKSIQIQITKIIIQAIGRICRTNNKSSNIYVYADSELIEELDTSTVTRLCNPEYIALLNKATEMKKIVHNATEDVFTNNANRVSNVFNKYIQSVMSYEWNDERMHNWAVWREFVLKHPTISKAEYDNNFMAQNMYIRMPTRSNIYWYCESNDYENSQVHWTCEKGDKTVSVEDCRLESLLKIEGVRSLFEENGWATEFENNEYIMCPALYNNIYKGVLGEAVGKYIFEHHYKYVLTDITDVDKFEKFDFYLGNGVYVDFKHWKDNNSVSDKAMVEKITNKLDICKGKKALIVNILADNSQQYRISRKGENGCVLEIPFLCETSNEYLYNNALLRIKEFIDDTDNQNQ